LLLAALAIFNYHSELSLARSAAASVDRCVWQDGIQLCGRAGELAEQQAKAEILNKMVASKKRGHFFL
jgi:hypothetical protein